MKISNPFAGLVRALADTSTQPSRSKPKINAERGVNAGYSTSFDKREIRADDVTIDDLRNMRRTDGTANAIYLFITLPVKAAEYSIESPDEGVGEKETEFVREQFMPATPKTGMELPFPLLIADMLRALEDGFRLYEKVWTVNSKNQWVYKKIAPRDAASVTLRRDKNGEFDGANQRVWAGTKYFDETFEADECFLFTFNKEHSYLYGESLMLAAYAHFVRKQRLEYLQELGFEVGAIPPRKLKIPATATAQMDTTDLENAEAAADNFGHQMRITLPEGFDLQEYKTNPQDIAPAIEHEELLMARSTLTQAIAIVGAKNGSRATSSDQSDMASLFFAALCSSIEHHINAYLIPDLIDYNFGTGVYPVFKFEQLDDTKRKIVSDAFNAIISANQVPAAMIQGIVEQMADQLGIELPDPCECGGLSCTDPNCGGADCQGCSCDCGVCAQTPPPAAPPAAPPVPPAPGGNPGTPPTPPPAPMPRGLSESQRKDMAAVSEKLDASIADAVDAVKPELDRLRKDTLARVERLLKAKNVAALKSFELMSFDKYRKALEDAMMAQYLSGKRTAADSINAPMPQTPAQSKAYVVEQARAVADKQQADLLFAVKAAITKELRTSTLAEHQLGILDILAAVGALWDAYSNETVPRGIDISLTGAFNLGRNDSFTASSANVAVMEFSAIIDERTTPLCKALNGSVLTPEQYRATKWIPPLHWGCRSFWVAYGKDDSFIPELKPIPDSVNGQTGPELSELAAGRTA